MSYTEPEQQEDYHRCQQCGCNTYEDSTPRTEHQIEYPPEAIKKIMRISKQRCIGDPKIHGRRMWAELEGLMSKGQKITDEIFKGLYEKHGRGKRKSG